LKNGLELLSPVDDLGRFTVEAGERFEGLSVLGDGNVAVINALEEEGALLLAEDYNHKYPYDWRTKKPTIFRATDQWFASVEGFRDQALDAIETVRLRFLSLFRFVAEMMRRKTSFIILRV
jgi:isoleucyl-tRNA synthetase